MEALFDVHVVETGAPSHCHRSPDAIQESNTEEKIQTDEAHSPHLFILLMGYCIKSTLDKVPAKQRYVRVQLDFAVVQAVKYVSMVV